MIECGANEVPKAILKDAFELGQKEIDKICDIQSEFLNKLIIKEQEVVFNKPSEAVIAYISNIITEDKLNALTGNSKVPFNDLFNQYKSEVLELCAEKIASDEDEDFTESTVNM
jgi:polyribonucleotide nucleotidyltransferase